MEKLSKVTPYCVERGINGISVSSNNKPIYVCHQSKVLSSHSTTAKLINMQCIGLWAKF